MRRLFPIALLLAFGFGCAAEEASMGCVRDADCEGKDVCWPSTGKCITPAEELKLGLEVLPPENNQGWVTQEFVDGERDLQLSAAISLQGTVVASDEPDSPLFAHVRVWRQSRIEGRPTVMAETSTGDSIEGRGQYSYALWLAPEHTYSVFATPEPPMDSELPPTLEGGLELQEHTKKDLVLDGTDRAVEVHGMVLDAAGKALPYSVNVRAAHEGGWLRSTPSKTCAADNPEACGCTAEEQPCSMGHFAFRIPFGVKTYTLYVEPRESAAGNPDDNVPQVPVMKCPGAVLGLAPSNPGPDAPTPAVMELADALVMPAFPKARLFDLPVVGEDGEAVAGATVLFTTELTPDTQKASAYEACSATYKRSAITDAEGVARLWLLPGSEKDPRVYRLTVVSPPTSPYRSFASSQYALIQEASGALPELELARLHELSGQVLDSEGEPIAGARIEAQGVLATDVAVGVPPGSTSTEADEEGQFLLYVDPGTFHFNITPREGSGVPRFSLLNKDIGSSSAGLEFSAPRARLWRGRLLLAPTKSDGQQAVAANFTVNAYATVPKSTTQKGAGLRASVITDEAGYFLMVLPAAH